MSKSAELRDAILQNRKNNIWQISLAVFLCQHQLSHNRHFHCEQPHGSNMLTLECFCPIRESTKPSTFDLCSVGNLRETITQKSIRKRLTVCTTSKELHPRDRFPTQNHPILSHLTQSPKSHPTPLAIFQGAAASTHQPHASTKHAQLLSCAQLNFNKHKTALLRNNMQTPTTSTKDAVRTKTSGFPHDSGVFPHEFPENRSHASCLTKLHIGFVLCALLKTVSAG